MGEIVKFNNKNKVVDRIGKYKKKKFSLKKLMGIILTILTTFCTITGITAWTLLEKDWQKIAEQYNNEGLELYNLTRCATLYRTIEKAKKRIKSLPNFAGQYLEYQLFDFSNITCFPKDAVECHAQIMTQNLVLQTGT